MATSRLPEKLAVDANPILSAVIGGSALKGFWDSRLLLHTTVHTVGEVLEYLPRLAQRTGIPIQEALASLYLLPLTPHGRPFYRSKIAKASKLIGDRDPDDVDLLALALKLKIPIWTNDKDFENAGIATYTTAQLLSLLNKAR